MDWFHHPMVSLISQISLILIFSHICALVLKKIGQPRVIGEMIAGILLGKSVFAFIWPEAFNFFFSEAAMSRLYFLSQFGLIFFMFVVGLEFKFSELKNRALAVIVISHTSIIFPFILGILTSFLIYKSYGPKDISLISFSLFMGISMSITAFPVLARILQEKKIMHTPLGAMAIACAAVDDITAWCLLAAVIGFIKAKSVTAGLGIFILLVVYIFLMLKVVKPLLKKTLHSPATRMSYGQFALIVCVVLGSSLLTQLIGIHALFGAFLAGIIIPDNNFFKQKKSDKIKDFASVFLLPLFFAFTGLRTEIGLLDNGTDWLTCACIILVAIIGKLFGSALAAKWMGSSWTESWSLGILMNTRGLMELIVLNIGYDLGILPPKIFTMLVIMALVTTIMTTPLLSLIKDKSDDSITT